MSNSGGYRQYLSSELSRRKSRNPLYSIRAFARDLGVGRSTLAEVLAAKRHLSIANAKRVVEKIALSPLQVEAMFHEIRGISVSDEALASSAALVLDDDAFRLISDWYYFAILNLARIPGNRSDAGWVSRRLGITRVEARDAVARLTRLGYLEVSRGKLVRTSAPIDTTRDIPSVALRNHHRQNLRRAECALDEVAVALRDISSLTIAVDSKSIAEAKKEIMKFKRRISALLETKTPDEVYTLAIQFFPAGASEKGKQA